MRNIDAALADANQAVRECLADMTAEGRTPISFEGCNPWSTPILTVVQHDAGPNWILVSHDGLRANAKLLPLTYTHPLRAGKPIVTILHTAISYQAAPPQIGMLMIYVPGWLASKRRLCQAHNPQLSDQVEWTDAQRAAWRELTIAYHHALDAQKRKKAEVQRARAYRARRADLRAAGQYTVTELARGAR